jgi:hypothetical protein
MNTFSINKKAIEKIQSILNEINYSNPVAVLVDISSNQDEFMNDVKNAFLDGGIQDDLIPMVRKRFREVQNQLTYRLMVVVYEKHDFKSEDLIFIEGITFGMDLDLRKDLREYCLMFERGHFILRSANNIAVNLQSVINLKKF